MPSPLPVAIVGAGHRAVLYASYALQHPDQMKVTAVVDPNPLRRDTLANLHNIPPENRFPSVNDLAARPHLAHAVINGTMDSLHIPTTLPLLDAGFHVLLEKPIATSAADVRTLHAHAQKTNRTVMICHVLRYAPFYAAIRKLVHDGVLGQLLTIESAEHVSYFHMAVGFVRGKWANQSRSGSSMLLAKCCHDLDLLAWYKSGIAPAAVHSFGGLTHFRKENAPLGSGKRCLVDCRIEPTCPYSAKTIHLDQNLFTKYVWESIENLGGKNATREQKIHSLKTDNPHGRCVWHSDNDVVDHQTLITQFADGTTATHTMVGGASKPCRTVHIVGTKGEIQGVMEDGHFLLRTPAPTLPARYTEQKFETAVKGDPHGGGDLLLVQDFLKHLQGHPPSLSATTLQDSIHGHLIAFAADESMLTHLPVTLIP